MKKKSDYPAVISFNKMFLLLQGSISLKHFNSFSQAYFHTKKGFKMATLFMPFHFS